MEQTITPQENQDVIISPVEEFDFYKNDSFGLKTTDQLNKWKKITIRGVKHEHWIRNASIISTCILPYLT